MNSLTMFDAILLWDKVLSMEERKDMIKNHWSISSELRNNEEQLAKVYELTAENMSDIDLTKLHQAMILSPRTMYFMRKLEKIDRKIEVQWNKLRRMLGKQDSVWLLELDIMPKRWAESNYRMEYNKLSYTVKHLLRASFNPITHRFEPLNRFGKFPTKSE